MKHLGKYACCLILLALHTSSFAQKSTKKEEKKKKEEATVMNEALRQRYEKDSRYAQSQRAAFNRSSWIGLKLADLIQNWGPPTRVVEDGGGGKIAVYDRSSTTSGGSYTPGYIETATNGVGQTVITGSKAAVDTRWSSSYAESTAVYADKNGIITKVTFDNDYKRN